MMNDKINEFLRINSECRKFKDKPDFKQAWFTRNELINLITLFVKECKTNEELQAEIDNHA